MREAANRKSIAGPGSEIPGFGDSQRLVKNCREFFRSRRYCCKMLNDNDLSPRSSRFRGVLFLSYFVIFFTCRIRTNIVFLAPGKMIASILTSGKRFAEASLGPTRFRARAGRSIPDFIRNDNRLRDRAGSMVAFLTEVG